MSLQVTQRSQKIKKSSDLLSVYSVSAEGQSAAQVCVWFAAGSIGLVQRSRFEQNQSDLYVSALQSAVCAFCRWVSNVCKTTSQLFYVCVCAHIRSTGADCGDVIRPALMNTPICLTTSLSWRGKKKTTIVATTAEPDLCIHCMFCLCMRMYNTRVL